MHFLTWGIFQYITKDNWWISDHTRSNKPVKTRRGCTNNNRVLFEYTRVTDVIYTSYFIYSGFEVRRMIRAPTSWKVELKDHVSANLQREFAIEACHLMCFVCMAPNVNVCVQLTMWLSTAALLMTRLSNSHLVMTYKQELWRLLETYPIKHPVKRGFHCFN